MRRDMSKKQQPNLAAVLGESAGSRRQKTVPDTEQSASAQQIQQNERAHKGSKPITVHFKPEVRDQLKLIALEQRKPMQYIIAEAYNDLFAKYGKPEIAPTYQSRG
jgi:hypothetical protein